MELEILANIKQSGEKELSAVRNLQELENWRIKYLGRKSKLIEVLHHLSELPVEERKKIGHQANEIKNFLASLFQRRQEELKMIQTKEIEEFFDYTLPGKPYFLGHLHPLTRVLNEIIEIFTRLGFALAEGPEIETDYYNFEALNMPKEHPARDMQDSFYLQISEEPRPCAQERGKLRAKSKEYLLRTHTSPVQIHVMEANKPPVRVIMPGRVYRHEAIDPSHSAMFHQVEGLAVDERITFADLKGTLYIFAREMFGEKIKLRFRPSYFPFVEPGAEVDISCLFCLGKGCRVCKHSGYLELLGAGMVHPKVFQAVGYNPKKYTGFAFGLGVERITMLKYGIDDMRLFFSNDLRFLNQF